ncbi:hypothetical protein RUM44_000598 [Polyplax serrata]|uniref:Protein arginine N-methyltransferase n=1 Tax=Polyplax serrata TaxID=468196 RepID=A0ABR1B5W1_POLSC
MEWKVVNDDYDYNQEIATSCYGDMLHDDERNKKFGLALKIAIEKFHSSGKEAHVLDIGTGTGLLSMLAVKYGADSVTACETFLPMANCAIGVINENGFSDKIKVVKSHSTSLTVGENGDVKQKANILVAEVFDTELIGEGAIKTFNHAFENLLTDDAIVIPSCGIVYAQVVESDLAQKWNKLDDWKSDEELLLTIPKEIKTCSGAGAVHDIQLSEFRHNHFKAISNPIQIFRFDWAKNKIIPNYRQSKSIIKAITSGKAQVVFLWWELVMDEIGEVMLSCAPVWEHPEGKGKEMDIRGLTKILPWRDHWMQAIYFFTNEISLRENDSFSLISSHDEFSFWFQVKDSELSNLEVQRPVCNCSFHFLLSRARIGAINDSRRRKNYLTALEGIVTPNVACIVLGDISLLSLLCAKLGARKVYIVSESASVERVTRMLAVENKLTNVISLHSDLSQVIQTLSNELVKESFDVLVLSEPYFRNSILPWDNMAFWYAKQELDENVKNLSQATSIRTLPKRCRLRGFAVQFDNLWRIATPLNICEGFSLRIFDELIAAAKVKAENYTEAQPLWEYPGIALSLPLTFFEFDFSSCVPQNKLQKNGTMEMTSSGRCDGIALWMEYDLTDNCSISFGPVKKVVSGQYVEWDMYERQGVHLFRDQPAVEAKDLMNYNVEFDPNEAEINFNFIFIK